MANRLRKKVPATPPPPSADELNPDKEVEVTVSEVVKDERTSKIVGSIGLLLAFFLFVAFTSYLFTWQEDQDKVHEFGVKVFSQEDLHVNNLLGVLGAYVAHTFIYNGFGLASYLFCTFFFVIGMNLLFGKKMFSIKRNVKYVLVGLVVLSTLSSFIAGSSEFSWGGAVGELINNWLIKWIGKIGTGATLFIVFFAYAIWRFNPTFKLPEFNSKSQKATDENAVPIAEENDEENDESLINESNIDAAGMYMVEKEPLSSNKLKDPNAPIHLQVPEEIESPVNPLNDFDIIEKEGLANEELAIDDDWEEEELDEKADTKASLPITPTVATGSKSTAAVVSPIFEIKPIVPEEDNNPIFSRHESAGKLYIEESVKPVSPPTPELEVKEKSDDDTQAELVSQLNAQKNLGLYEPTMDLRDYKYPTVDLLDQHGSDKIIQDSNELEINKNQIVDTLKNYDIAIQRISATVGPTVTLYEIVPAPGVRISRIKNLEDDIALSLAALGIRIIAPIPGKGTIGIEVPNVNKTMVSMRTLISSEKFQNTHFSLPIAIGKKIDNENFIVDLAAMPHLLMAGATGQGKSVGINAVLVSLLYKKHPSQLKLVLVDPKKVELSLYKVIEKHFLAKLPGEEESIITDTKKVVNTLNALCIEMDNRYELLKEAHCRNIKEYNEKFINRKLNPKNGHQYLPFIVLVVDEFADLIMTAGKEVEMPIARLAQLARAIGIHLIIATQRPSVNIITGTIKANFPARVAFKVSSKIDSRTILDAGGAEQLIGKGDMLISYNGEIVRLQCAFVDTPEVDKVCSFIGEQRGYPEAFLLPEYVDEKEEGKGDFDMNDKDPLFEDAARLIVQNQVGSTSLIQRRMKLGYNRAGRLMDQLERAGIVGPNVGSKAREVRFTSEMELEEYLSTL